MGTIWIPGAIRITPSSPGGTMSSVAPPRVVWHTVEAPAGKASTFQSMINVLKNKGAEPQVLYDPVTDRLGQFMPLNVSGRALKNDGANRTNRTGRVCIQIEVMGYAKNPFTDTWKPGPNFRALMAAIRSWGIPDVFPMGNPPRYPGDSRRDRAVWQTKGGHYCHANIPGNNHGDPGAISPAKLFAAATTKPPASNAPPPQKDDEMTPTQMQDLKDYIEARTKAYATFGAKHTDQVVRTAVAGLVKAIAAADATAVVAELNAELDARDAEMAKDLVNGSPRLKPGVSRVILDEA